MMVRCGFASVSALLFIFFRMFCDFLLFVCFYLCMKSVLVMWDWVWCIVSLPRLDHCNLILVNFRLLELCVCCVLCENNVKNSSGRQRQSRFGIRPAKNEMHQLMSSHICDWVGCCWWNCFFFLFALSRSRISGNGSDSGRYDRWQRMQICVFGQLKWVIIHSINGAAFGYLLLEELWNED